MQVSGLSLAGRGKRDWHNSFGGVRHPGQRCIREEKPATAAKVVTAPASPTQNYRVIYNFTGGREVALPSSVW